MHKTFLSFGGIKSLLMGYFPGLGEAINQVIALVNGPTKTMNLAKCSSSFTGVAVSPF